MKKIPANLFTATLLAISFMSSQSFASNTMIRQSSTTDYTMKEFTIAQDSYQLPVEVEIANANISVNTAQKTVTLTVYRRVFCPPGRFCTQMMPAPLVIELPLTYVGSGFCGGTIMTASKDETAVDGYLTEIQIYDDNGNKCNPNPNYSKSVTVTITEQSLREVKPAISTMVGFPSPINYLDAK